MIVGILDFSNLSIWYKSMEVILKWVHFKKVHLKTWEVKRNALLNFRWKPVRSNGIKKNRRREEHVRNIVETLQEHSGNVVFYKILKLVLGIYMQRYTTVLSIRTATFWLSVAVILVALAQTKISLRKISSETVPIYSTCMLLGEINPELGCKI